MPMGLARFANHAEVEVELRPLPSILQVVFASRLRISVEPSTFSRELGSSLSRMLAPQK